MSVFAYNPDSLNAWSKTVVNYLNGGSESIGECSKKFNEQIETLVQPNVWTGPAAYQNFQNFLETHKSLITFIDALGNAFEEFMLDLSKNVASLESANLGNSSALKSLQVDYTKLNDAFTTTVDQSQVVYDYTRIQEIGKSLNSILTSLEGINNDLHNAFERLDDKSGMWDGNAAANAKQSLNEILTKNMSIVTELLTVCIKNISGAAEAASNADR